MHTSNHGDSQEEVWNCSSASKTDGNRLAVSVVISKLHQVYSAINDNSQNHFSRHRQIVDGSVIIQQLCRFSIACVVFLVKHT